MPGRLAIDFGTSNTVLSVWDAQRKEGVAYHIPDFGKQISQGDELISVVPSLIHYTTDQRRWIGNQVLQQNLYESPRTFRWMKRYIGHRNPLKQRVNGREISYSDAGRDFLNALLIVASQDLYIGDEEIALTVPVEAFEHYEEWLAQVAESADLPRFRLIDEPSAAALGYGAHIQPGSVYLIFDFGGGTLHVSLVLIEAEDDTRSGRRCRVLGKAGIEIGGATIDQWLFQEVLRRNQRLDMDEDIRQVSNALLVECERVKEKLSFDEQADLSVMNPDTGAIIEATFTRAEFDSLLDQHEVFAEIHRTVRAAINAARERGYDEDSVQAVLLVGGSSQIPAVQRTLRQIFDRDRVLSHRPLDAVARGGAAYIAGVDFYDHIQHDYAIRFVNPQLGGYDFRVIVPRGTPYPTQAAVARLTVKATYEGQTSLGLAIFEMSERRPRQASQPLELVFDPSGAARIMRVSVDEEDRRTMFWMNETHPTFLEAAPPSIPGEPRFEIEFNIDDNKRLLVSARDIKTGLLTHRDYPVVKLT